MSPFPHVTPVFLDKIIDLLVPLFLLGTGGNLAAARHTARTMLASYDAETEDEIRLAAEIASFGFGALEALSKSMDPDLSLNAVLRLRGCANAMHRSGHQCQRALDKLRQERRIAQAAVEAAPAAIPESEQATSRQAVAGIPPSRQQRRAMERAAEKAQRRKAAQARLDAMRAARTASTPMFAAASVVPRETQAADRPVAHDVASSWPSCAAAAAPVAAE